MRCSADCAPVVATPSADFSRADLHACDVHALKDHRPCKARLFDEVALFVLREASTIGLGASMPHAGTPRQPRANRGIPIRGVETDRGMLLSA